MRTIDVLKKWCKITDPEVLEKEVIRFETAILNAAEEMATVHGKSGIEVLPGVRKLLDDLSADKDQRNGEEKWAICTSCKRHEYNSWCLASSLIHQPPTFTPARPSRSPV
jgi:glycerol 3-phosphatase-1